jgi:hypothetical protein
MVKEGIQRFNNRGASVGDRIFGNFITAVTAQLHRVWRSSL